jgi:glycosyltransferase involved in cell wall biosynthesis
VIDQNEKYDAPSDLTVAHVIHSLGAGGAETVLVELAKAAPSAGIRLIVIGLSDARCGDRIDNRVVVQLREHGVTVHEMHAARYDPTTGFRLANILRDESVDVVHTHLKHADVVGGLAARLIGVPSVSTLHIIDIPKSFLHRLRFRAAVFARQSLSNGVIAVSRSQRDWYNEHTGGHPEVTLIPNGIGEPLPTRDPKLVRAELGVPPGALLAMCVGLMRPEKGHAELVDAIRLVAPETQIVFAFAGDGPLFDSLRLAVESDAVLRERVLLLGFRSDIDDLVSACDFIVHPSLEDALPTALISALACGRPIVATNVGGIPDIVGPGCGTLVDPRPSSVSAAISDMAETLRSKPVAAQAIRVAARERYENRFAAEMWVRKLRNVYLRAIIARGRPTPAKAADRRRRITMVEFSPSGGLFQLGLQLGEALARAGEDVEIVTGPSPELASREPHCRLLSILPTWHPTGADAPDWWRRARRVVRAGRHTAAWVVLLAYLWRKQPDVVVWSVWRFPIDGWGVRIARRVLPRSMLGLVAHEARPLVEQPGGQQMYKSSGMMNRALGGAYADLDIAFALGEQSKQNLLDAWPITAPVHIIHLGGDTIYASTQIAPVRMSEPVALSFGTITTYKGIDTLCDAWPKVRSQVPDAELNVVGALSADVDESALRRKISELDGIRLEIGYVPVADVPKYFGRARCVVMPYKRASQSAVAHVAHTLRRPVVATHVGDIPAVVRDKVSGLLVAPDDPDALSRAIITLLSDAEMAQQMGDAGAESLAATSSWDHSAELFRRGLAAEF